MRVARLIPLVCCLLLAHSTPRVSHAQDPEETVERLIERLTPRQRVGQLFLVPFHGSTAQESSDIARLVDEYGVGGVSLSAERGNFSNTAEAPAEVARLTNELQTSAADGAGPYVPLFIALEMAGDSYPDTALWGGMTPLPSQMALGATWQPEFAESTGEIVGRELAAVGVNLLLGPSLDVLNVPRPGSSGDLGVRSYGGSPSWVALFGRRYIQGVHRGSGGRVATAAGSYPGIGGADRSQSEELPVVESTLQQLSAVELAPFVAVSDGVLGAESITDAFVTSHVRYRGVQQQTDRPLSLDSGGLRYLWAQVVPLGTWRDEQGGLLVSSGLGLPAVRRYVDPNLASFNARRVIREALAAGNDLLNLTGLAEDEDPAFEAAQIEAAIEWLVRAYEEDEAVRDMVHSSLERILRLKLRLYPAGNLGEVKVDADAAPEAVGLGTEEVSLAAREALTLVTHTGAGSSVQGISSPQSGEQILFVVDARQVQECESCTPYLKLDPAAVLAQARRAYGPEGTGRLRRESDVAAISFRDLKAWLQARDSVAEEDTSAFVPELAPERLAEVSGLLQRANWIIFAMLEPNSAVEQGSDALKLFLKASPPEAAERRLVAIAFGAPYYLDTTEIAKLSTYYAVYSTTAPFVNVAVRALFGDEPATGASPVSIPGAGYDLGARLEPALDQSVTLELVGQNPQRALSMGTTYRVRTSVIHDANGHVVPDGTNVTFRRYDRDEDVFLPDVPAQTASGQATSAMRAERNGELAITAALDNGLQSEELVLRIEGEAEVATQELGLPEVPLPAVLTRPRVPVDWGILLLSLSFITFAGVLAYGMDVEAARSPARLLRMFLLSLAWGLAGYLLVAAGGLQLSSIPGGSRMWPADWNVAYQAPLLSFVLATLPVLPGAVRAVLRDQAGSTPDSPEQPD